jgi:integrase/recombinase XerD
MKQNAGILFHGVRMEIWTRSAYDREGKRKYLTRAEGERFLKCALQQPNADALFCLMIYYTGCRISEALGLTLTNLDLETKVVRVQTLKQRGITKIRRVPIPDFLATNLSKLDVASEGRRFWLFSRCTGRRIVKKVMKAAGISGIHATPKGLRHGFGVRAALEQIPVNLIQSWMGHADATTTAIYLSVRGDEEHALIKKTWRIPESAKIIEDPKKYPLASSHPFCKSFNPT